MKNGTAVTILSSDFLRGNTRTARLIGKRAMVLRDAPDGIIVKVRGIRGPLYLHLAEVEEVQQ